MVGKLLDDSGEFVVLWLAKVDWIGDTNGVASLGSISVISMDAGLSSLAQPSSAHSWVSSSASRSRTARSYFFASLPDSGMGKRKPQPQPAEVD